MKIGHLIRPQDFSLILKKGRKYTAKTLSAYVSGGSPGMFYLGLIVPEAQARLAVRRNYIKRVIYAFFRDSRHKEKLEGKQIVIKLVKTVSGTKKEELLGELQKDLAAIEQKGSNTE